MRHLTQSALVFCTVTLAACGIEPDPVGEVPPEAIELEQQALRFGSFSFADPAVGFLVVGSSGCTGTLIDPQVVLTAAHCVAHRTGTATGSFRIEHSASSSFTYDVQRVKSYGSRVGNDDVAIVHLRQAVPYNVAAPMGLNPGAIISMHERITMYGYGCRTTDPGDTYAGRKQRYDTTYALTIYGCYGDSGGPLIKTMARGERVVSKVFSGMSKRWPWSDWEAEYGLVYQYARAINDQADLWAGRPVDPPPGGGGGGGHPRDPNDPPIHEN